MSEKNKDRGSMWANMLAAVVVYGSIAIITVWFFMEMSSR